LSAQGTRLLPVLARKFMGESRSGCVADDCSFYDVKRGALHRVSGTNRHRMHLHRGLAHRQMRGASLAGDFHFSDAVHVGPSPSYAERQFCDFDHCPSSAGAAASVSQSRHREAFSVWTGMHWEPLGLLSRGCGTASRAAQVRAVHKAGVRSSHTQAPSSGSPCRIRRRIAMAKPNPLGRFFCNVFGTQYCWALDPEANVNVALPRLPALGTADGSRTARWRPLEPLWHQLQPLG